MMKLLLIVGAANDVFIYNMAKWLKHSMDVEIDVFEFYPSAQQGYDNRYYDAVYSSNLPTGHKILKYFTYFTLPYLQSKELARMLKGKHYDIIHCHWLVPPLVLTKQIKEHCSYLYATFWGREYDNFNLLGSNRRYRRELDMFIDRVDYLVNSKTFASVFYSLYPNSKVKYRVGNLGAASLEHLYEIMDKENKSFAKQELELPEDKLVVLIGYSGKPLHRHVQVIKALANNPLKDVHILAPMTRGASQEYINEVELALKESGYSYTLLQGRFMTDKEIAMMRYATDVTLQLSSSDGFSRSIVESLCAKSILIYGDWLDYDKHLEEFGFNGIKVSSIQEAISVLEHIINNRREYDFETEQNSINGKASNIWSECIKDWVDAYQEVL